MNQLTRETYQQLMMLQWYLRHYQMVTYQSANRYENSLEGQGRVLALLQVQPEIATRDMSYILGLKQQSLNELLQRLEKSGHIERKPSPEDKRVMIVHLTDKGRKVEQPRIEYEDIFTEFNDQELEQLMDYIDRMIQAIEERVGDPFDDEMYQWMGRIHDHFGTEKFAEMVDETGFGGMPFNRHHFKGWRRPDFDPRERGGVNWGQWGKGRRNHPFNRQPREDEDRE